MGFICISKLICIFKDEKSWDNFSQKNQETNPKNGPDPNFKSLKDIFNLLSNRPLYTKKQQNTQFS